MTAFDLEIRAGIHTGECEIQGNTLAGMAVHIASRIQASALPGEVLVSSTVKDLAVGSTLRFVDRGEKQWKGVTGRVASLRRRRVGRPR
jgi:class 3 adenylate cyclase